MPGQPAHFEIPADDTAKGRQFWGSLFDWQFEASPGPFEYYMTRISIQQDPDELGPPWVRVTTVEQGTSSHQRSPTVQRNRRSLALQLRQPG